MDEDDEVMRKAFAAYFRGGNTDQPGAAASGVELVGGLRYAVLRNVRGVLAVYRVRNDGMLKGLKRWPAELDGAGRPHRRSGQLSINKPLPRTGELLALDRPLTPAEMQEAEEEMAFAKREIKEFGKLLSRFKKAIKEAP